MARDTHPTKTLARFPGLDNINKNYEVGTSALTVADNVDITRSGKIRRRKGQTQVSGSAYLAMCSCSGFLFGLDSAGTVHQLDSTLASSQTYSQLEGYGPHLKLRAVRILDSLIFSNGIGVGLCNPETQQSLTFDENNYGDRSFDFADAPPFNDVENFAGRNFYAIGEKLYYSLVFGYFKVRFGHDYFRFPDTVTMVAQVEDGLFVSTLQQTYFLSGRDPKSAKLTSVDTVGAIEGTKTYVDGSIVGEGETTDTLPMWATSGGFCVGLPNGEVLKATRTKVALPKGFLGSMMFREQDGQNHIVSVIQS